MVMFKNDLDTFCKYLALRPPNIDRIVHQHREDRHLEGSIRGIYYVARYRHQLADGEAITVELDQYCGRLDPDEQSNLEAQATAIRVGDIDRQVHEAVALVGGAVRKGAERYTGELLPPSP
jgi:hypothetical protein